VVGEFVDDGVSATRNKPEDRPGWRQRLRSPAPFDAVVVWKVDRLARRVIDFLHADETLQARGAAIVCVEQSIDMTTGEGRAFAQMLAVFGEMGASATSSRILAAWAHLVAQGRIPSGSTGCAAWWIACWGETPFTPS
jgi:site-specific DNA recombinase